MKLHIYEIISQKNKLFCSFLDYMIYLCGKISK